MKSFRICPAGRREAPHDDNPCKLSARELDAEIRRLTAVARDGKATPTELASGTFTLNNHGEFGVDGSAASMNYPEVAILVVGRIIDKPWVADGQLACRRDREPGDGARRFVGNGCMRCLLRESAAGLCSLCRVHSTGGKRLSGVARLSKLGANSWSGFRRDGQ